MTLKHCISESRREAIAHKTHLVIVEDAITNAEEDGDFGYCPAEAASMVYPHGTITHQIDPEGKVTEFAKLPADFALTPGGHDVGTVIAFLSVPESILDLCRRLYNECRGTEEGKNVIGEFYGGEDFLLCFEEDIADLTAALLAEGWPPRLIECFAQLQREDVDYIRLTP